MTHSGDRPNYPAERGFGNLEFEYMKQNDGMVGLIPTDDMIVIHPPTTATCESGLVSFKQEVRNLMTNLGAEKVALGSDINAPLTGLSPDCGGIGTPLERMGFYTYSLWPDLNAYIAPSPDWQEKSLAHFLKLWERVWP